MEQFEKQSNRAAKGLGVSRVSKIAVVLATVFVSLARAEIPQEFYSINTSLCERQIIENQSSDGGVILSDAARCDTLYSDIQLLEIVVEDLVFEKEIYIYDHAGFYESQRAVKVYLVNNRSEFDFKHGRAMYLGKTSDGHDRFIVSLVSEFRPTPAAQIGIYVKTGGRQFETTGIRLKLQ